MCVNAKHKSNQIKNTKNFFYQVDQCFQALGRGPPRGAMGRGQTSDLLGTFVSMGGT
jgi:hypothetical protein